MYPLFPSMPVIWSMIIKFHMSFCENDQPVLEMKIIQCDSVWKMAMFWGTAAFGQCYVNRKVNNLSKAVQLWEWLVVNVKYFVAVERLTS